MGSCPRSGWGCFCSQSWLAGLSSMLSSRRQDCWTPSLCLHFHAHLTWRLPAPLHIYLISQFCTVSPRTGVSPWAIACTLCSILITHQVDTCHCNGASRRWHPWTTPGQVSLWAVSAPLMWPQVPDITEFTIWCGQAERKKGTIVNDASDTGTPASWTRATQLGRCYPREKRFVTLSRSSTSSLANRSFCEDRHARVCDVQSVATSHACLLNTWNVADVSQELNFYFI